MAGHLPGLLLGEHLGLGVEEVLIFAVVDLGVPGGYDEHTTVIHQEGQRLGDAGGDDPHRLSGQLHSGAGDGKL